MSLKQVSIRILLAFIGSGVLTMLLGGAIGGYAAGERFQGVTEQRLSTVERVQAEDHTRVDSLTVKFNRHMNRDFHLLNKQVNHNGAMIETLLKSQGIEIPRFEP